MAGLDAVIAMPQPALDTHAEVRTLKQVQLRLESIESSMATQSDLKVLGAETKAAIKELRSEMFRMFWLQGGALATLIVGLGDQSAMLVQSGGGHGVDHEVVHEVLVQRHDVHRPFDYLMQRAVFEHDNVVP